MVFSDFSFSFCFFFKCTLGRNEEIHTGHLNRTGVPDTVEYFNGHSYDLKTHQPESNSHLLRGGKASFFFHFLTY